MRKISHSEGGRSSAFGESWVGPQMLPSFVLMSGMVKGLASMEVGVRVDGIEEEYVGVVISRC